VRNGRYVWSFLGVFYELGVSWGGDVSFLDRLNVECPSDKAISRFQYRVYRGSDTGRYDFNCVQAAGGMSAPSTALTCYNTATTWVSNGGGGKKDEFLDRLGVKCHNNEVLQQFRYRASGGSSKYEYRCCTVDGRNDMHAMQQDNAWLATNGLSAMATVPILKDHSARGVHVQALDSYATGVTTKDGTAPGAPGVMPSGTPPPGGYNVFDPHYSADGPLEGGVTTGVFTGHSMVSKGGPLTFGKKTYHNVFDPDGGEDMGPCDPGQTGKAGTSTQKRECRECAATKWCAGGWDGLENDCPDQSTSYVGSYSASQCTCQIGWYGEAHYDEDKSCKMCKGMTFCPGGRNRYDCPIHSSSSDERATARVILVTGVLPTTIAACATPTRTALEATLTAPVCNPALITPTRPRVATTEATVSAMRASMSL